MKRQELQCLGPLKPEGLRLYSEWFAPIHKLPQDVLAEKLASPYQQQDTSTQSVRRCVPDFKLLEATLDAIVVERPSPTGEAPQHLCLKIGDDFEPSRDVLLERGYIAHIRSIGEEKDEAGQRRYPVRLATDVSGDPGALREVSRHRLFH